MIKRAENTGYYLFLSRRLLEWHGKYRVDFCVWAWESNSNNRNLPLAIPSFPFLLGWVWRHNGPKSLILAPQDIPDISGCQLRFGCQCVKAYNNENHVINQKILQIRFVSNLDICKIVIVCPGQHHVKAQVWSFKNVREKQQ